MSGLRISAAEGERLKSWALEIADFLMDGVTFRDEGPDRRHEHMGGLLVHRGNGAWYCHAAGRGGHSTIGLIKFVKNCSWEEATSWSLAWLVSQHRIVHRHRQL